MRYMVSFSPTGSTEKVMEILTGVWDQEVQEIDLTDYQNEKKEYEFRQEDLVYMGVPSYGGRVPATATERLNRMKGNGALAVVVVSFGNRAYEDTLLELKQTAENNGFHVVGAVAAVTEHNIMHQFATGRPDEADQKELLEYGNKLKERILSDSGIRDMDLKLPGNEPYKDYHGIPLKPHADKECIKCGLCAKLCPVGAISAEDPSLTDDKKCISCMRCISVCPEGARGLNKLMLAGSVQMLKKACSEPKKNECYIL